MAKSSRDSIAHNFKKHGTAVHRCVQKLCLLPAVTLLFHRPIRWTNVVHSCSFRRDTSSFRRIQQSPYPVVPKFFSSLCIVIRDRATSSSSSPSISIIDASDSEDNRGDNDGSVEGGDDSSGVGGDSGGSSSDGGSSDDGGGSDDGSGSSDDGRA